MIPGDQKEEIYILAHESVVSGGKSFVARGTIAHKLVTMKGAIFPPGCQVFVRTT